MSYDWIDEKTQYETRVLEADYDNVEAQARTLGDEGYIITAFGRNAQVLLRVGTRPEGTSAAHPVELLSGQRMLPDRLPGAVVAQVSNDKGNRKVIIQH